MGRVYYPSFTGRKFHQSDKFVRGIKGPIGCTDADTEYLSPTGWRRIGDYDGGLVAQWSPDGALRFVEPDYVEGPCEELILFENTNSVSMCVSPNHRMPLYDWKGDFCVKTAERVEQKPSRHVVPTAFTPTTSLGLSDLDIRLRVMIAADGCYPKAGKQAVVCVRKERKKDRVRHLLTACGIPFKETGRIGRPTETFFTFDRPLFAKPLHESANWYQASREELAVLLDEMSYWDGLFDHEEIRFHTSKKEEADAVQFAAHACGRCAHIRITEYKEAAWADCYCVSVTTEGSNKRVTVLRGDNLQISRVRPTDGRQYCFTVPSSFWLARREGKIFVTGNSGKSVTCCLEILRRARQQIPGPDGVRRSRWAITRNTYAELKSTTIKTWEVWCPPSAMRIIYDAPIRGTMRTRLLDKTWMELEVLFLALDRPDDVGKVLSLELTGAWMNEAREQPMAILDALTGRVNRYPSLEDGGFNWSGIIMDTNPPDTDHWWHRVAEEETPLSWEFFAQPAALTYSPVIGWQPNPAAENIENLQIGYDYYLLAVQGKTMEWCKVYVLGQYGSVMDGKPVYPEYNDDVHSVEILAPITNVPLIIGLDFGLTPAASITQLSPRNQLRLLTECTSTSMGIRQFARNILSPHLAAKYPGMPIVMPCDPAGTGRAQTDERTCFDELVAAGFAPVPAYTNAFLPRREAVAGYLLTMVDGQPGFLLSRQGAPQTRKGFLGGYRYRRVAVAGTERFTDEPDKNQYSHPHDALQYAALQAQGPPVVPANQSSARPVVRRTQVAL